MNDTPIIFVDNLTKDYGEGRGVFDVTFQIPKSEVFGFLGPNGAGKSTTIRHLMGFSKPDKGETEIFGLESFKNYYKFLNKVGYIPGEIALPAGLTGFEFIKMMQDMQGIHDNDRVREILNTFSLEDNILKGDTKKMSLGQKRKLAITVAFMHDPEVLIMDEPTSGLDPIMQEVFINVVKKEKERGKTILLSSHIFSEVDATCDRISIIKDGRLVSTFVANDLKHAAVKYYDVFFKTPAMAETFIKDIGKYKYCTIVNHDLKQANVFLAINDKDINRLIKGLTKYEIVDFSNRKESLEDYFMKFYKEDKKYGGAL